MTDVVVRYDPMRNAANNLAAPFISQITVGSLDDPAIHTLWHLDDHVDAIDVNDRAAQEATRFRFNHLHRHDTTGGGGSRGS